MSARGHCDHSCHFIELCIQEESDRGYRGAITRLRGEKEKKKSEDLHKIKGNVEKKYSSHFKGFLI